MALFIYVLLQALYLVGDGSGFGSETLIIPFSVRSKSGGGCISCAGGGGITRCGGHTDGVELQPATARSKISA